MKQSSKKRIKRNGRSASGAILFLAIVITVCLVSIATPVIVFCSNYSAYIVARSQVKHMANEGARVLDQSKYWLGLPRPDFNASSEQEAEKKVNNALKLMAAELQFGEPTCKISFKKVGNKELTVCELTVPLEKKVPFRGEIFGFNMGNFYPKSITLSGQTEHKSNFSPYGVMHMDCPVPIAPSEVVYRAGEGPPLNRGVAVLPAFGFWHQVPRDHGVPGEYLPLGGFKGTAPITDVKQFAAFNLGGYISRNELIDKIGRNKDGTIMAQQVPPAPGNFITTAFLKPESYESR